MQQATREAHDASNKVNTLLHSFSERSRTRSRKLLELILTMEQVYRTQRHEITRLKEMISGLEGDKAELEESVDMLIGSIDKVIDALNDDDDIDPVVERMNSLVKEAVGGGDVIDGTSEHAAESAFLSLEHDTETQKLDGDFARSEQKERQEA